MTPFRRRCLAGRPLETLALTLVLMLLGGCSTPYRPAVVVHGASDFQGLAGMLPPSGTLDLMLVHGMCTPKDEWAAEHMARIADIAGSTERPEVPEPKIADLPPEVATITQSYAVGNSTLRISTLVWAPLTAPLKRQLDYDGTGSPTDCAAAGACKPQRALLNGLVKDKLLNDCLADALAYQGRNRQHIETAMVEAMTKVLEGTPADAPVVLMSVSLGSKIAFDALAAMLEDPGKTSPKVAMKSARIGQVFMLANQMPILGLADQEIKPAKGPAAALAPTEALPGDALRRYLEARKQPKAVPFLQREALRALTVVAFSDPNDLLSYRLADSRYGSELADGRVRFADVLVSNASVLLGLAARPDTAHGEYLQNEDVARFIACGKPYRDGCK